MLFRSNESFSEGAEAAAHAELDRSRFASNESRNTSRGILDFPHYTRPQIFRGWEVPEVLMSGNHEEIRRWRRQQALAQTLRNRPELLGPAGLDGEGERAPTKSGG